MNICNNIAHERNNRSKTCAKIKYIRILKIIKENENNIMYIKANDHYTGFNLKNGKCLSDWIPLKYLEECLDPEMFFRSHKSYFINMYFVKGYHKQNSILIAELPKIIKIPVARARKSDFKKEYNYILTKTRPG